MPDPQPNNDDLANATEMRDASARKPSSSGGGEDESSTSSDGDESGLHEDQKPIRGATKQDNGGSDRHKTEELTKAGRDIDPDDGSE